MFDPVPASTPVQSPISQSASGRRPPSPEARRKGGFAAAAANKRDGNGRFQKKNAPAQPVAV